jgi:iron complex outermembrane receptor protein
MQFIYARTRVTACVAVALTFSCHTIAAEDNLKDIEHISVHADKLFRDTTAISPTTRISAKELSAINLLTSEDAVAYEPNVVIRRRYVGDPNGTLGIRGSGMFQTARSLVFADGLPLHYLLQTRWSGAPRWSLVGPDEIASAEVIYGPFSAEYSGNAMGGVVNITTRAPEKSRVVLQGSSFAQQYDVLGTDDTFSGNRLFVSYEDKFDDLGIFLSYNRLDNDSHPMTNYSLSANAAEDLRASGISGFIDGVNDEGEEVIYIGDSGAERSVSELLKGKFIYDLGFAELRGTVAYETRTRDENDKRNYLRDASGNVFWGAGNRNFEQRSQERESLLIGVGISGELSRSWHYDIYATDFDLQKDREIRSGLNPQDPAFGNRNGRLTEYQGTGWNTLDIKAGTETLWGDDAMRLSVGIAADRYQLGIAPSNIDALTGTFISNRAQSRGETRTQSVFAQYGWAFNPHWDLALGLRWEKWETRDGLFDDTVVPQRSLSGFSPKFSLAYMPNEQWRIRYSLAKALRFPISEELYRNEDATTNIIVSDPNLNAEDGIFHNLSFERLSENGLVRVNLFKDLIDDTIYFQRGAINDNGTNVIVTTFLAIDQVDTQGAELIVQQSNISNLPLSVRFNLSYTDAIIEQNNANTAIEGNRLPRIPQWRANAIVSYQLNDTVDLNASARYASNSFGQLDNLDTGSNVFGAIDDYVFVNVRSNWQVNNSLRLSVGIDNLLDELAYVAHPWPSRTFFLEARYVFEGR